MKTANVVAALIINQDKVFDKIKKTLVTTKVMKKAGTGHREGRSVSAFCVILKDNMYVMRLRSLFSLSS